jgi:hypothetical protein
MAIVKVKYVKRDKQQKHRAKAAVRYMQHRPGKEGKKLTRTLFGSAGVMDRQEAYGMIDEAGGGSIYFRFIISPDPSLEDKEADLDLRAITLHTMQTLEESLKKQVDWVGAVHAEHSQTRHVHLLATVPQRLGTKDLELLRTAASAACLAQRQVLDLGREEQPALHRDGTGQAQKGGGWERIR